MEYKKTITWSRREDGIFKAPLFFITVLFWVMLATIFNCGSVDISISKIFIKKEEKK